MLSIFEYSFSFWILPFLSNASFFKRVSLECVVAVEIGFPGYVIQIHIHIGDIALVRWISLDIEGIPEPVALGRQVHGKSASECYCNQYEPEILFHAMGIWINLS